MYRITCVCVVLIFAIAFNMRIIVARMGRCERLCSEKGERFARFCIEKFCSKYLRDHISMFGKRASTTIVGVQTESEGATIDINVKTKDVPDFGLNKTAWNGLIYLTLLHLGDKKISSKLPAGV